MEENDRAWNIALKNIFDIFGVHAKYYYAKTWNKHISSLLENNNAYNWKKTISRKTNVPMMFVCFIGYSCATR